MKRLVVCLVLAFSLFTAMPSAQPVRSQTFAPQIYHTPLWGIAGRWITFWVSAPVWPSPMSAHLWAQSPHHDWQGNMTWKNGCVCFVAGFRLLPGVHGAEKAKIVVELWWGTHKWWLRNWMTFTSAVPASQLPKPPKSGPPPVTIPIPTPAPQPTAAPQIGPSGYPVPPLLGSGTGQIRFKPMEADDNWTLRWKFSCVDAEEFMVSLYDEDGFYLNTIVDTVGVSRSGWYTVYAGGVYEVEIDAPRDCSWAIKIEA